MAVELYVKCTKCNGTRSYWAEGQVAKLERCDCGTGYLPATPEQIVEAAKQYMLTPDELAAWIESCGDITKD